MSSNFLDFKWYAENVLMIQTKLDGLQPFKLRKIQQRYVDHLNEDFKNGIVRSIVLKPRQSGFSTVVAGINSHRMFNWDNEKGIVLADKLDRSDEVFSIYNNFRKNAAWWVLPKKDKKDVFNTQQIHFERRNSGFKVSTQNDPHAGRAGTRKWAHLSEYAFYSNADSIDEGIQNSMPLAPGTRIFKESTAFGMSGIGKAFYDQWEAAVRKESIYRPFFVAWYEVEDYTITGKIDLTPIEKDMMKMCKGMTVANLVWRRLKLQEYASSTEQIFTPEERFCQDFPSFPSEAFLNSGRPVFQQDKIKRHVRLLMDNPPEIPSVRVSKTYLAMYEKMLTVYKTPETGKKYTIGADVAEGLATGDFSAAFIMDTDGNQVAHFHGKLDPDHFGKVLVELAKIYNEATIVPEINNMGSTTLNAIKDSGYLKVYMRSVFDEIGKVETQKMGWRTTVSNKQTMLSKLISMYRDGAIRILDINLVKEMGNLTRESNGDVTLNGQDRVVAACLACMGLDQIYQPAIITTPGKPVKLQYSTKDLYREKKLHLEKA